MKYRMIIPRISDEKMIAELQRIACLLEKESVTISEFDTHCNFVDSTTVQKRFGSWNRALLEAGLKIGHVREYTDEQLFNEMEKVWNLLSRRPKRKEFRSHSIFSEGPYRRRWGTWKKACEAFISHKNTNSLTQKIEITPETLSPKKRLKYGKEINFRGLKYAPTNEMGVVFLFALLGEHLGFNVEIIQSDFPDCIAKRLTDRKKGVWQNCRIEFEYESKSFLLHGHKKENCDLIVCWNHNWTDCPVEVVSLKKIVMRRRI